jgi:hypothetical protein
MPDHQAIARQILENCAISDANFAGGFSVCGLVLRLRELFKWEHGLDPWVERDSAEVLEWIGAREEQWERMAGLEFKDIRVGGCDYDPFDSEGVNKILEPEGLWYGAGYARGLKPVFLLAEIEEKRIVEGQTVYILGRELARDLFAVPAFTDGDAIVVRTASARTFIWDQIAYGAESGREALRFALRRYGLEGEGAAEVSGNLEHIVTGEIESYIRHELGELLETKFDRATWRELVAAFPHSPVELLARAVKDLLADTGEKGTLEFIIKERRSGSLGFYVAFLDGLRKVLFPEIREAFETFAEGAGWQVIKEANRAGRKKAEHYADIMSSVYRARKDEGSPELAAEDIRERLLEPLGISWESMEEA